MYFNRERVACGLPGSCYTRNVQTFAIYVAENRLQIFTLVNSQSAVETQ